MLESNKRILLFILLVLLLPVTVHAYSIDKAWVDWQGHEVKTLSPTQSLPGSTLKFLASSDFKSCFAGTTCSITVDASSLAVLASEQQRLKNIILDVKTTCTPINESDAATKYICSTAEFQLATVSATNKVSTKIKAGTANKIQQFTINLLLDSSAPKVTGIRTQYCDESTCYVSNELTKITVTFEDEKTAFDYGLVFVGTGDPVPTGIISDCTGSICTGTIALPCRQSGQEFTLKLSSILPTKEDAQNLAVSMEQKVQCALDKPELISWAPVKGDGPVNLPIVGGSVVYSAKVRSYTGTPIGYVNASNASDDGVVAATCIQDGTTDDVTVYDCNWQIRNLKLHPKKLPYDLAFVITDAIGNSIAPTKHDLLLVMNLTTLGAGKSPNLFDSKVGIVYPEEINRITLDLAARNHMPYPSYVTYTLKQKKTGSKVLYQTLNDCWTKLPTEVNYSNSRIYNLFSKDATESRVLYPARNHTVANRLNLQMRAPEDIINQYDTFDVTCQIDLTVSDGTAVYATPERENITFKVHLRESKLGQPGAVFVQKIKAEEERLNGPANKFLKNLRTVRATLDGICNIMEAINGVGATGAGLNIAGQGISNIPVIGTAIGGGMKGIGGGLSGAANKITQNVWQDGSGKSLFLKQVCAQVNCRGIQDKRDAEDAKPGTSAGEQVRQADSGMQKGIQDYVTANTPNSWKASQATANANAAAYEKTLSPEQKKEYDKTKGSSAINDKVDLNAVDFKNSFIMSVAYMCVGGVVYNAGKWQDINCGYLQCLKDQSVQGGSVYVCEMGKSYKMCTQVVGEFMELPFVRIIKNLMAEANWIANNIPGALFKVIFASPVGPCVPHPFSYKFSIMGVTLYEVPAVDAACTVTGDWKCSMCHLVRAVTGIVDMSRNTNQIFNAPMHDDAICLQALCNDPNQANCAGRSYDKVEAVEKYTSYLRINTYLKNEQKRQGAVSTSNSGSSTASDNALAKSIATDIAGKQTTQIQTSAGAGLAAAGAGQYN